MAKVGFWLTDASAPAAEIAAELGFEFVVLDVEHGMFDLATLERYVPLLTGLGFEVFAKVLGPGREPIQQALDFGCHGVIIPHVESLDHAREVTAFAKFPPAGKRSLAGGRTLKWGPITDDWIAEQDAKTLCFPLIEDAGAVADIEKIAALPTVDGFQIGPTDLSTSAGRGAYKHTAADWADIERCVEAFDAVGKPWLFPAWTPAEQEWALSRNASRVLISMQYYTLMAALRQAKESYDVLAIAAKAAAR
ncbi:HpcH/HpaI aldolase family protein [Streptomyces acidicola]|uniref:HpcH/HpaI aldolase family protein n=1 Tax=Streptomyces acidicola TaxID=2596892 RepID=UPI003825FA6B